MDLRQPYGLSTIAVTMPLNGLVKFINEPERPVWFKMFPSEKFETRLSYSFGVYHARLRWNGTKLIGRVPRTRKALIYPRFILSVCRIYKGVEKSSMWQN